jgi:hypothetical protein
MKIIAKYFETKFPPLLQLSVFDAPHRRMHMGVIKQYRQALYDAVRPVVPELPIAHPIDLHVLFIEPSSPDNGNLYLALEQALDGKTMTKHNAVLVDDGLVSETRIAKFFPHSGSKK